MATFDVTLTAYFSDSVQVEAEDLYEAQELAIKEFEDSWLPLSQTGGYTHVWDYVNVEMVEELSNED